jgi:SAM-dependent methyltransferase
MLEAARQKAPEAALVLGDLRRLPFQAVIGGCAFDGALCLESPLAYLLDDAALAAALKRIRSMLDAEGKLVVDVYDYIATLGTRRIAPQEAHFENDRMRVTVRESHHYEKKSRIWTMHQRLEVEEADEVSAFDLTHHLRMRTLDEYAQSLETAGFSVLEALTAYPNTPENLRYERRLILVAGR